MTDETNNNNTNDNNEDRKKREEARRKKKQRLNRKKQIEASQKQAEEIRKQNRQDAIDAAREKMGDEAPKVYNREGQEVADDGSIIVDDSPITGPVIEPAEGDIEQTSLVILLKKKTITDTKPTSNKRVRLYQSQSSTLWSRQVSQPVLSSIPDEIDKRVGVGQYNMYNFRQQPRNFLLQVQ